MTGAAGSRGAGVAAACAAVLIWASFLIITRFAVQGTFTVAELLFLRLVPAAVLLVPIMLRDGVVPRGMPVWRVVVIMIGAGVGFPAILMAGLTYAPASDAGALAPGTLPFWTAIAVALMIGEVPGPRRRIGLGMILAGALMVSLWEIVVEADDGAWRGHLHFLTASALWAVYTVVFRQSGLSPIHALAIGMFWSMVVILPVLLWIGLPFEGAGVQAILVMGLLQSVLMGILSLLFFGYAVRALGAAETGAFGALVPILALVGGAVFLAEEVDALKVAGVVLVAAGVFMASGILTRIAPRPALASATRVPATAAAPVPATTDRR